MSSEAEKIVELNITKVAERIKQLRKDKGFTSSETFANDKEINRVHYWRMEKGTNMTLKSFFNLLIVFEITPEEFFKDFS